MTSFQLNGYLRNALFVALTALALILTFTILSLRNEIADTVKAWQMAGQATTAAVNRVNQTAEVYGEQLTSAKNLKALDAGIAVGASAQGTLRLFNTTTLPRINATLDGLTETTRALQAATWETKAAIAVNGGHLSEILTQTKGAAEEFKAAAAGLHTIADATGAEVPQVAAALRDLIASGKTSAEQVNGLLANPKLSELLVQAERLLHESADVAANLDATTAELPPIAKTARRWQTPLNVARLVSVLVGLL